ncbi:ceef68d0-3710-4bb2-9cca-c1c33f96f60d [Sclerotinia trifoliorum]|uniref:Ceef68d0-3710-4bb2-9cca-c1c33f96f60d n=1 Tax=Sclerotinia trifoliorum TaxID=28548 RepID=A0A8H2VVV2_9HELO|nr:ceef68d0-3710-4bb2-9cca-c1c33f96f60d [Sclerotinia trifoliorum]
MESLKMPAAFRIWDSAPPSNIIRFRSLIRWFQYLQIMAYIGGSCSTASTSKTPVPPLLHPSYSSSAFASLFEVARIMTEEENKQPRFMVLACIIHLTIISLLIFFAAFLAGQVNFTPLRADVRALLEIEARYLDRGSISNSCYIG